MKGRWVCLLAVLFIVSGIGCATKAPVVTSNSYVSQEGCYEIQVPQGWSATVEKPGWLPEAFIAKSDRLYDRVFLSSGEAQHAVIIIELKNLTWAKNSIHPAEWFFNKERVRLVCNKVKEHTKSKLNTPALKYYEWTCYEVKGNFVLPEMIHESTVRSEGRYSVGQLAMVEETYVYGEKATSKDVMDGTLGRGYRIMFTLASDVDYVEEGADALKEVISSIQPTGCYQ